MSVAALANEAWISIGASRLRSLLAMLGIVIGVGSVVLMLAIGAGSRQQVEDAVKAFGSNLFTIMPGYSMYKGVFRGGVSQFTLADADAIGQLSSVLGAAPLTYEREFQASFGKNNLSAQVAGTTPPYFDMRNWSFAAGRPFTADDVRLAAPVAVIGATVAGKLFPDAAAHEDDIVGSRIEINHESFRVAGVLKAKGAGFNGNDQDNIIIVPISSAKVRLWGGMYAGIVSMILVQATAPDAIGQAEDDASDLLRQRHHLSDSASNNFNIRNMTAVVELAGDTTRALSLLLGAVASISLVVGGIGIMNIMLVNVAERSREIGIRKALGATERQILDQFLFEAIMITGAGSVAGLAMAAIGALAVEKFLSMPVGFTLWFALFPLGVAGVVGVASGIYPALKASRMQPVEALRIVA